MYTAFASVYDRLMADVDYPAWAAFYRAMLVSYGISQGKVCECACGTGSLTLPLQGMGYQMTGVDQSADMLFEASQKARKAGAMIPFVKQDMRLLHLHRQMDAVLCTNDGLNYLPPGNDVLQFLIAAFNAIRPGGVLAFDLSTPHKLQNILGNNFWGDETEDIAYLWQNQFDEAKGYVEMDLAIFAKQKDGLYRRIGEHQRQYIHDAEPLMQMLSQVGFQNISLCGDLHMEAPANDEKRWHIIAQKPLPVEEAPQDYAGIPEEGETPQEASPLAPDEPVADQWDRDAHADAPSSAHAAEPSEKQEQLAPALRRAPSLL